MSTYAVSQKIRTVAHIDRPLHLEGITVTPVPKTAGSSGLSWIADLDIDAVDADTALIAAWERIIPLLDKLALISQCAFSMAAQSYLVRRLTDNPGDIFFMFCARARHPNGMPLWSPEQLDDVQALSNAPEIALRNFREAANASMAQSALSALIIASEALAGTVQKVRKCQCGGQVACPECGKQASSPFSDEGKLQAILGETAYKELYRGTAKRGPVRHKLLHGSGVPTGQILTLLQNAYEHFLGYMQQTYNLKSVKSMVNAPRSFTQFEYFADFGRMSDGSVPDIALLDGGWPCHPTSSSSILRPGFRRSASASSKGRAPNSASVSLPDGLRAIQP
jgi:hypothetical protein